jgi:hypothetical protein
LALVYHILIIDKFIDTPDQTLTVQLRALYGLTHHVTVRRVVCMYNMPETRDFGEVEQLKVSLAPGNEHGERGNVPA